VHGERATVEGRAATAWAAQADCPAEDAEHTPRPRAARSPVLIEEQASDRADDGAAMRKRMLQLKALPAVGIGVLPLN
jgi:hypothetical protein